MLGEALIREALGLPYPHTKTKTRNGSDQMTYQRAVTEQELTEKAVASRVTDEQVEAFIKSEHYFTAHDGVVGAASVVARPLIEAKGEPKELQVLTFCVLVLANGFTVHGFSACADPNNFDPEIGRRIARANAKAHVWGHLGFELRTKLNMIENARGASKAFMTTHVGTKVIHAMPMTRGEYNTLRGWELPANENGADPGYLVEYADGGDANVAGFAGYVSWSPQAVFDRSYGDPLK